MRVKICGMRDPANILEIEALKPDLMGFIFYPPSPRFVRSLAMEQLDRLWETGIEPVAVFVNESTKTILRHVETYGFNCVQLHGSEDPEACTFLKRNGLRVIKAIPVAKASDLDAASRYEGCCDFFLFDTKTTLHGGSGKAFDWTILQQYQGNTPFFLSGGVSPDDADAINTFIHPMMEGIDLNSRFETAPGMKNADLIKSFLHQLKRQ